MGSKPSCVGMWPCSEAGLATLVWAHRFRTVDIGEIGAARDQKLGRRSFGLADHLQLSCRVWNARDRIADMGQNAVRIVAALVGP